MNYTIYRDRLEQKLRAALAPSLLVIEDQSALHAGHGNDHAAGETHFKIRIVSEMFKSLSRVARHRLVYNTVAEELAERVHALALETLTGDEDTHK